MLSVVDGRRSDMDTITFYGSKCFHFQFKYGKYLIFSLLLWFCGYKFTFLCMLEYLNYVPVAFVALDDEEGAMSEAVLQYHLCFFKHSAQNY